MPQRAEARDAAHQRIDHALHQRAGDAGIDRVAALAQHVGAGLRRLRLRRHDHRLLRVTHLLFPPTSFVMARHSIPTVALAQHGGERAPAPCPWPATVGSHSASACRVASCGWPIATTKPWRRATASVSASLRRTASSDSSSSRKTWRATLGHAELLRELVADRLRRGARVEEHQAARLELAQHRLHARSEGGEAAAHVVVDADIAVEAVERRRHALAQLGVGQRHQQRVGSGIGAAVGLHRQMQHQLLARARAPPAPARADPWHRAGTTW